MGANEKLNPPTSKMKQVRIAFDVDGTLRDNTKSIMVANEAIRTLLITLSKFKNTYIIVWSGSGQWYAQQAVNALNIGRYVDQVEGKENHQSLEVDIAIDDIQDTAIGKLNLIVNDN